MNIKIITYNIWQGKYFDKMLEFLRTEKPDIVHLQETDESMTAKVAQAMGMQGEYRYMFKGECGSGVVDLGVAILTRLPIVEAREFRYEREFTEAVLDAVDIDRYFLPRVLLGVKVNLGNKPLWLFNTHFTITPDAKVTERQLESARAVKGFLADYDEYILTGDMNTPYNTETYHVLSEGLVDVSHSELPSLHPTIHKVGNLGYHVDYVFLKGEKIQAISSKVPVVDSSDHLPVVAELEIGV